MAIAPETSRGTDRSLQDLAKRHLWMHFARMGAYADHEVPIIARGEGCYVWDEHGNRYLDGLSGLFCVNAGHGRTELGEAAARQVEELDFYVLWSYAHPRAIELAARIASLTPEGLDRVFFTSGGSEAVESAMKLVRQHWLGRGEPLRRKLPCIVRWRSSENFTASASSGSSSWNFTSRLAGWILTSTAAGSISTNRQQTG